MFVILPGFKNWFGFRLCLGFGLSFGSGLGLCLGSGCSIGWVYLWVWVVVGVGFCLVGDKCGVSYSTYERIDEIRIPSWFRSHIPFGVKLLDSTAGLMVTVNSSINFIIYSCIGKSFRKESLKMVNEFRKQIHMQKPQLHLTEDKNITTTY